MICGRLSNSSSIRAFFRRRHGVASKKGLCVQTQTPTFSNSRSGLSAGCGQNELHAAGRSNARAGQSPHNYAMAIDVVHSVHGWEVPELCWDIFEHVGKEVAKAAGIPIEWGGDWTNPVDCAHWELADWRERAKTSPFAGQLDRSSQCDDRVPHITSLSPD